MNILLYTPPVPLQSIHMDNLISSEPLELEYLYTVLHQHHTIFFLEKGKKGKLIRTLKQHKIDILCISVYLNHTTFVREICQDLRKIFPHLYIVVGGVHPEVVPEQFFIPEINAVVFANHLQAISQIADNIQKPEILLKTEGVAFADNGFKLQEVKSQIEELPIPKRVLFDKNPERYFYMYLRKCASIKTALSCPGKCTFCFCRKMNGGVYHARPVADVIAELETIETENIFVVDDNFLTNSKRLETFCEELEKREIRKKFIVYGTSHFISTHESTIARLKKNGLIAVIVGFEYISDQSLENVHKGATASENDRTIEICNKYDIELYALFICNPDWHHADFRQLFRYIRKNKIQFATFSTETVMPGTDLALEQKTVFDPKKMWRYDLLRLHKKTAHISPFSYYMWLFVLYLSPIYGWSSAMYIFKKYGFLRGIQTIFMSIYDGFAYFTKIIIWK
jgi:radical SAM superfamily enzyme YgiQ (UPF0313 family)